MKRLQVIGCRLLGNAPGIGYMEYKQLNHKLSIAICLSLSAFYIGAANASSCTSGYYLNENNKCVVCTSGYYCPGNDTQIQCPSSNLTMAQAIEICAVSGASSLTSITSKEMTSTPSRITHCTRRLSGAYDEKSYIYLYLQYNPATQEYTTYQKAWFSSPFAGYYVGGTQNSNASYLYRNRYACTNAPNNAHYAGAGTPNVGNCPWKCDSGYVKTSDGLHCTSDVGNSGFCIPSSFTITYVCPNGGNTPASQTVSHGIDFTTADASHCNGGYDVWRVDDGLNTKITSNTTLPYPYFRNITLTAAKRSN